MAYVGDCTTLGARRFSPVRAAVKRIARVAHPRPRIVSRGPRPVHHGGKRAGLGYFCGDLFNPGLGAPPASRAARRTAMDQRRAARQQQRTERRAAVHATKAERKASGILRRSANRAARMARRNPVATLPGSTPAPTLSDFDPNDGGERYYDNAYDVMYGRNSTGEGLGKIKIKFGGAKVLKKGLKNISKVARKTVAFASGGKAYGGSLTAKEKKIAKKVGKGVLIAGAVAGAALTAGAVAPGVAKLAAGKGFLGKAALKALPVFKGARKLFGWKPLTARTVIERATGGGGGGDEGGGEAPGAPGAPTTPTAPTAPGDVQDDTVSPGHPSPTTGPSMNYGSGGYGYAAGGGATGAAPIQAEEATGEASSGPAAGGKSWVGPVIIAVLIGAVAFGRKRR